MMGFSGQTSFCSFFFAGASAARCSACTCSGSWERQRRVGGRRALVDADSARPHTGLEYADHRFNRIISSSARKRDDRPARVGCPRTGLEPAGSVSGQRDSAARSAPRSGICVTAGRAAARSFERSTTFLKALMRLKRSTSTSGSGRLAGDLGDRAVGPGPLRAAQRFALVAAVRPRP